MEDLQGRIQRAIEEGRQLRAAWYAKEGLDDLQELGPPASEESIKALEAKLDANLPPSYRIFLRLHDGWRMAGAAIDLLSVGDMIAGPRAERIRRWQEAEGEAGDDVAANGLVIAEGAVVPTKLILDPSTVDASGEWLLVRNHKGPEETYDSFVAWLEDSVEMYRDLLSDEPLDDEAC